MRIAYIILSYLLTPVVLLFLLWRGVRNPAYFERMPERFGFGIPKYKKSRIWVHAVSVGEVQAASTLVERLLTTYPDLPILLTTVTPTGAARAKEIFGERITHHYAPYDFPFAVKRFFTRIRPQVVIIIETELWPTLYHECGRHRVPLILASARISPRSVSKYQRFIGLFSQALSHGIVIAAQSEADAARFRSLGANPDRTHVTGNIKFDFELPKEIRKLGLAAKHQHAPERPIVVAASTHENEEELVLEAMQSVWSAKPDCLLILAPRHPERFALVGQMLEQQGIEYIMRTSNESCRASTRVLLLDTIGELRIYYAACDVAFVGGSLVPVGGHNLLEPAVLEKPIITGSHLFNSEDIAEMLVQSGAATIVDTPQELAETIIAFLADKHASEAAGFAGLTVVKQNRGALDRLLNLIGPLL